MGPRRATIREVLEGLEIRRKLTKLDPANAQAQDDVAVSLLKLARVDDSSESLEQRRALLEEAAAIYKLLAELDPKNERFEQNLQIVRSLLDSM